MRTLLGLIRTQPLNFFRNCCGGYAGERSLHLEEKRERLLRIKADEENKNVKQRLDEYIEELAEDIERARIDEEREF